MADLIWRVSSVLVLGGEVAVCLYEVYMSKKDERWQVVFFMKAYNDHMNVEE